MKKHNKLYYGGKWQSTKSDSYTKIVNPATEEIIAEVINANYEDVDCAVDSARTAFKSWNETPKEERRKYIEKIIEIVKRRSNEIAETIVSELGTSIEYSRNGHLPLSIREMEAFLEEFDSFKFEEEIDNALVIKEGIGVIACITPWNYPLNQIQRKVTPALLMGNTVIVKPATNTPLTALIYAEIMEEAGLPSGVFNVITGGGNSVGDYLAKHQGVDVISFTGSTQVGKSLYTNASTSVKKLILELGGKSAMIYLKGGNLEKAIQQAANTVLDNQGQTCTALTRLLIPQDELEEAKKIIKEYYSKIKVGNPMDSDTRVGPLSSKKQLETVLEYVEIGKKEGAELFIGGKQIETLGFYMEPAVFINANNNMRIAQEEIFGPVLTVITYKNVEEAIDIANDSIYGLSGAVVGPKEEAIKVARKLRTGNIYVNGAPRTAKAPFGGYKQSGIGRENGRFGLEDASEVKAIFK